MHLSLLFAGFYPEFTMTQSKKKASILTLTVLSAAASLPLFMSGCETVKGAGQDLQNASTATERAITGEKK